jgi:predicted N-formylglutamate amidohydrolase
METQLLLTCEHGGNRTPQEFTACFRNAESVLASHRGFDPGALELARYFARRFKSPLIYSTTTRLLVELNRSLHHRSLFSEFTRGLDRLQRDRIINEYYLPYRARVEHSIAASLSRGTAVLHLSLHSFTPNLNGVLRRADVGLLFDPSRQWETRIARAWQTTLRDRDTSLRVRRNYPYLGKADGLTTYLRRKWPEHEYAGIELEVNQCWVEKPAQEWRALQACLANSLDDVRRLIELGSWSDHDRE